MKNTNEEKTMKTQVKYKGSWRTVEKITDEFVYARHNNGSIPRYGYALPIKFYEKLEKRQIEN